MFTLGRFGIWLCVSNAVACTSHPVNLRRSQIQDGSISDVIQPVHDARGARPPAHVNTARADTRPSFPDDPGVLACKEKTESVSTPRRYPWPPWCGGDSGVDPTATPPPNCIAPCLWDLIKSCLPRNGCD